MTQQQFLTALRAGYDNNVKISERKNADYATDGDAFKNFRASELVGLSVETGILVRMTDKLSRISNLIHKDAAVKDESLADSCSDLSNYAMILKVYLENKNANLQNTK